MSVDANVLTVSVVIVSYNTRDKLRRCLCSLGSTLEAIVVDNGSLDGSPEMVIREFPSVRLIENSENRGFGAANNQGAAAASHPLVLYLNSDAYPAAGAIQTLASAFSDPSVAGAGPMLLNMDDTLQESAASELTLWAVLCEQLYLEKLFRKSGLFSPYWITRRLVDLGGTPSTPQVMGAALMCRAGLEQFDERFFLYCEDTDFCKRLRQHGSIVYVPGSKVHHELGSSSSASRWKAIARYNRGKELYFRIHHSLTASMVCLLLDRLGALVRLVVWGAASIATLCVVSRFRTQALMFAKVVLVSLSGPKRS